MKTSFMWVTLERIKEFQDGMEALGDDLAEVKAYVLRGREISPELKEKADRLQALRREAIVDEMYYLAPKAEAAGFVLPEDYLDGTATDPVLDPALYALEANFSIFDYLSWYDPLETAMFAMSKLRIIQRK